LRILLTFLNSRAAYFNNQKMLHLIFKDKLLFTTLLTMPHHEETTSRTLKQRVEKPVHIKNLCVHAKNKHIPRTKLKQMKVHVLMTVICATQYKTEQFGQVSFLSSKKSKKIQVLVSTT